MSIWHAKHESVELVIGNIMIAIGGFLIGYRPDQSELGFLLFYFPILSAFFILLGIFFDVRVLKKFSYDLTIIKNEVNKARTELRSTISDSKETKGELKSAKKDLVQTIKKLKDTEADVDVALSDLKKTKEKIFGTSGGVFSGFSWAHSMEDKFKEIERKIEKLIEEIRDIKGGQG